MLLITAAEKVMFSPQSVCLSVCVCLRKIPEKRYKWILMKFSGGRRGVSQGRIRFWQLSGLQPGSRIPRSSHDTDLGIFEGVLTKLLEGWAWPREQRMAIGVIAADVCDVLCALWLVSKMNFIVSKN